MVRQWLFMLFLLPGAMLWCSTVASGADSHTDCTYPRARSATYTDGEGREHVYLVQEPRERADSQNLLIYLHGSAGKEEQGMNPHWGRNTFARLRTLLNDWGWVYVCPRDNEFRGLLRHLEERYRPGAIYLAGASSGGSAALREVKRFSSSYAGLVLLGPAIARRGHRDLDDIALPMWIVSGGRDRQVSAKCRVLAENLAALRVPCYYREIAGGRHSTPLEEVAWQKALEFLQSHRQEALSSGSPWLGAGLCRRSNGAGNGLRSQPRTGGGGDRQVQDNHLPARAPKSPPSFSSFCTLISAGLAIHYPAA